MSSNKHQNHTNQQLDLFGPSWISIKDAQPEPGQIWHEYTHSK